jgi:hypothetical protein
MTPFAAAAPVFQLNNGYTVRLAGEQDRALLTEMIAADAFHADIFEPDDFIKALPGEQCFVIEDENGKVVLYFKTTPAVRIRIQFGASDTKSERERNRKAMIEGLAWLEAGLSANFRELIFDTRHRDLTLMAEHRLGFERSLCEMVKTIPVRKEEPCAELAQPKIQ